MGNSQSASYDVTNVREVKRQEKPDGRVRVKPLKEESMLNKNEKGKSENRSPSKIEEHHETHHEAHTEKSPAQPRKAAAPPPPEPANVPIGSGVVPIGSGVVVDDDIQSLHRTQEPETIPLEAAPSQSRYD